MSYPATRHTGSAEASATFRAAGARSDLVFPHGGAASYLATQQSTGGDYGLFRWDMGEQPGGPAAHFHRTMSEAFYVLRGTVLLYDGRAWREAGEGDFLYVPPGGVHAFRNPDGAASMLMLFAPGAPRQDYFEELAALDEAALAAMSAEQWTALYARHDQYEADGPPPPR